MSAQFTRLEGRKVALRPFTASDVTDAYVGWLNDPEVTRFSNQRFRTHDRASCEEYFRSFSGTENLFVSIRAVEGDLAIGTMTAYRVPHHGTCDVGIMIGERASDLVLEALRRAAVQHVEPGLDVVEVVPGNKEAA